MLPIIKRIVKEENGTVVVLIALAFSMLLGFAALSVDVGKVALEKNRLARTADAAALAGAQELPDTAVAETIARNFAQLNDATATITVSFSNGNKEITVNADKTFGLFFAKVLGFNQWTNHARAVARLVPVGSISGLMPMGINDNQLPLVEGNEYMLKAGAHDQSQGWRGIIKYPGSNGASDYVEHIRNGFTGTVTIGDKEDEETGNVSGPTDAAVSDRINACNDGCTWNNYTPDCPRVVLVPIYHDMAPANKVEIRGYTYVFLERVAGNGQDSEIYARYIDRTVSAEAAESETQYNTYLNTVRLTQ